MSRARFPWLLCALALLACEQQPAPFLDDIGDPCRSAYDHCLDDDSVRSCVDGVWVERDCDAVCAELGPAYVADGCDRECVCVLADANGCTPGETACPDAEQVAVCDANQLFETSACTDVCAGLGLESVGCVDEGDKPPSCWCTSQDTVCDEAAPDQCVDEQTLASCEGGVWSFSPCAAICGVPASCDPLQLPAVCACP